ncbi:putative acetyltransferase, partial [Vibrio parahaemolyticus EKP-021]
ASKDGHHYPIYCRN